MANSDYLATSGLSDTLKNLISLVKTCFGPDSRLKMLQKEGTSHLTITSSSGRLLPLVYAEEPVVKLMLSAMRKHVELNVDGGLFCLGLTATLIRDSILLDQNRILISKVYHGLHEILENRFRDDADDGVRRLDFTSLKDLIILCRSIVKTKSGCALDGQELDHICRVLVEAFVKSFASDQKNSAVDIRVNGVVSSDPVRTQYFQGILIETDEELKILLQNPVKFVIVTASMAGDHGSEDDVAYVGKRDVIVDDVIEPSVFHRWVDHCYQWIESGVNLVLCQKVVHWTLRDYLCKRGVLVIQRLGLQLTQNLLRISQGRCCSSILQPTFEDIYAVLKSVQMIECCSRSYYYLNVLDCADCSSLFIVNRSEESLAELEYVCRVALDSLRLSARHSKLIPGHGYFESYCAKYLREQVRLRHSSFMREFQCSRVQLVSITEQFCRSIQSVVSHFSAVDSQSNLVEEPMRFSADQAQIGTDVLPENESDCVDLLCVKLAALHTAVSTACGVMQVDSLIEKQHS